MKKERLFYLDFVRAIAAIAIIITHYNARFILFLQPPMPQNIIITSEVANVYLGSWGVSLFFIISGAALMYTYGDSKDWKKFYKKRFLSLYPMFWIAYSIVFLVRFYNLKTMFSNAPKINILLSVLGIDGYVMEEIPTFYILGEWFLGAIILFYLLFPLLCKLVNEHPVALAVITGIIYVCLLLCYDSDFDKAKIIFVRLPELLAGMYFVKYGKKINWKVAAGAMAVLVANGILKPDWDASLQTSYVGIASFAVLVFVSYFVKKPMIELPAKIISKYSYPIFLVHHVIIAKMMSTFTLSAMSRTYSYILFAACCLAIAFAAKGLFIIHRSIMIPIEQYIGSGQKGCNAK